MQKYINHCFKTSVSQEDLTLSRRPSCLVTTLWSFFEKNKREKENHETSLAKFLPILRHGPKYMWLYHVLSLMLFAWIMHKKGKQKTKKRVTCSGWTSKSCFIFLLADRSKAVCPNSAKQCNILLTVVKNYSRCTYRKLNKNSMCTK